MCDHCSVAAHEHERMNEISTQFRHYCGISWAHCLCAWDRATAELKSKIQSTASVIFSDLFMFVRASIRHLIKSLVTMLELVATRLFSAIHWLRSAHTLRYTPTCHAMSIELRNFVPVEMSNAKISFQQKDILLPDYLLFSTFMKYLFISPRYLVVAIRE